MGREGVICEQAFVLQARLQQSLVVLLDGRGVFLEDTPA